ncbi:MAG: sugar phosphate isomerase/epimerase [Verrucomicrobiota bacterium JB022]|nr:sugar phosphate isomerase/epimerase [Verrucomicrobiota bacterium JB022]
MAHPNHQDIRLGTLAPGRGNPASYIRQILPHGFECFQLTFGGNVEGLDLGRIAHEVREALDGTGAFISGIGVYANPLGDREEDTQTRRAWELLIDHAEAFGCSLVCGFTGRVRGKPIPESIGRYQEVFGPLADRAGSKRVRLAFENCPMGGTWQTGDFNIAHNPDAWALMFEALPHDNIGLEWEPCHQMTQLIDPLPQIREWGHKFFHLHGKDATTRWDLVKKHGAYGKERVVHHRTPGFGDSNWTDVISELRMIGYTGTIDIEGWHDPVYRDELEMTGQVHSLHYLKHCRGGAFIANPQV